MSPQIIGVSIVYSTVCSCADQRKHQSSASLAFARASNAENVSFDDVIMKYYGCLCVSEANWKKYTDKAHAFVRSDHILIENKITHKQTAYISPDIYCVCANVMLVSDLHRWNGYLVYQNLNICNAADGTCNIFIYQSSNYFPKQSNLGLPFIFL